MPSFARLLLLACALVTVNADVTDTPISVAAHNGIDGARKRRSVASNMRRWTPPPTPSGYTLVFGPTNGANNAPGYMGYTALDHYDVAGCAADCNSRGADPVGGACQYFNIWRGVETGQPDTYTCSMYWEPTDESTAVNYGQGDLEVTWSRGYSRNSLIIDGGFEGYVCGDDETFCYTTSYANWVGTNDNAGGELDATIFDYVPYAHTGHSSGLVGSADGVDTYSGTLTPAAPLDTVAGNDYLISFFQQSSFSGATGEAPAFLHILWNGVVVDTITPGYSTWSYYEFTVTAAGNDVLAFDGGSAPAWTFIDDVNVWAL